MRLTLREADQIYRGNLLWLMAAQSAAIIPLLFYLPAWVTVLWLMSVGWRLQIHRGVWRFPSMLLKVVMALVAIVAIYASYAGNVGAEPMVAFLVCSFVMKLVEMRSRKDALIVLFIGFIAIATQFLFAQDLLAGLYSVGSLFVLLSAWLAVFHQRTLSVARHLGNGALFLLHATPLMLLLFVVMPRLGPLWSVPLPGGQGKSGFSDSLELGDIGNLVLSSEVAFRASFETPAPRTNELYWRGLVLDQFDGVRWTRSDGGWRFDKLPSSLRASGEDTVSYSVVLEPHNYRWLFTLGYPVQARSGQLALFRSPHGLLFSREPVQNKAEYRVASKMQLLSDPELAEYEFRRYTRLPDEGNPRARALAAQWSDGAESETELIQEILRYFGDSFHYTLQSEVGTVNAIDDFLFESQYGFCEHFASAFVFLMRSVGVPARLVLGYQGGELNEDGAYYVVRQSDAHAWAEVWLDEQGWIAVDPTAVVAPERVDVGVSEALSEGDRALMDSSGITGFLGRAFMQRWDALGYSWNRWVLNYDSAKRNGMLRRVLGGADSWRVILVILACCALLIAPALIWYWLRGRRRYVREEDRWVQGLLSHLADKGVQKSRTESIPAFLRRAARRYPHRAPILREVAAAYEDTVYAQVDRQAELKQLAKEAKRSRFTG